MLVFQLVRKKNVCRTIFCAILGEDGPSQMALEDFAMFRSVATSICFYPSDAVSTERAIELAARSKGITFTRTTRPETAVIYANDEKFEVGKGKVKWYMSVHELHTHIQFVHFHVQNTLCEIV